MLDVSEEQVRYFRARRGHLAGAGAPNAVRAARALIGAQSQQLGPSLLALSLRTRGRPTADALTAMLLAPPPKLLRTWGQRDTLFIYDPADWPFLVAAREQWPRSGRGGPMPTPAMLEKTLKVIRAAKRPVARSDVLHVAPATYVQAVAERAAGAGMDARRLAASRLLWRLAHRGDLCVADKAGNEQTYALRTAWFPSVAWPEPPVPSLEAAALLTRRYLAVHGPATAKDVAHFFGARVTQARAWLAAIEGDLVEVACGDRRGLVALAADRAAMRTKPPATAAKWPLRLLPMFEAMLMAHQDKTWTVPDESERNLVWRKAGMVSAVALDRGRIVATWSHKAKRGRLAVRVEPLSAWSRTKHASQVKREAEAVAAHLGLAGADVT